MRSDILKTILNKEVLVYAVSLFLLFIVLGTAIYFASREGKESLDIKELKGTIISLNTELITIEDSQKVKYTINNDNLNVTNGEDIVIKYTGILDDSKDVQDITIVSYSTNTFKLNNALPQEYQDNGIFSVYYSLAYEKMKELTLDEKIGQILLVRYPDNNQIDTLRKYKFAGYVFFEKDFRNKTVSEVQNMVESLQDASNIPILTAVDEEGGLVVRISSNPNLSDTKFKSPRELYTAGGFDEIKEDTKQKSALLKKLGINVNLAPVIDVATDPSSYMYNRTIGEDTKITSEYAKTVIEASKGTGVSYTLKHFPGYGNNKDTHTGPATDDRTLEEIRTNDLPPFESGINAGAEAVLISHNIVNSIDSSNPASLSSKVHDLLRDELKFTGIIITDDLAMGATSSISDAIVKAIKAGNDLIITTDYEDSIIKIKEALEANSISESQIDEMVFRVLAWKYYKGLIFTNQK